MKGTIAACLEEMVRENHGRKAWKEICEAAGLPRNHIFSLSNDVPDADVVALIGVAAKVLGVSVEDAMFAFGVHWSSVYAPKVYGQYFASAHNAKQFLLQLDQVHTVVTNTMDQARPPHFTYDESRPGELTMNYSSARGLVALMPGLVAGVAKHFGEEISTSVTGTRVQITFHSAASRAA